MLSVSKWAEPLPGFPGLSFVPMVTNALSIRSSRLLMRRFGGASFLRFGAHMAPAGNVTKRTKYLIIWALEPVNTIEEGGLILGNGRGKASSPMLLLRPSPREAG